MVMMPLKLQYAVRQIRRGGVIAYPTEAVWGLGCDPLNGEAVERLLAIKQRPVAKGLILVAASVEQFAPYLTHLSPALLAKFSQTFAYPVTWLVPVNNVVPAWISGDFSSVALRVSTYKPVVDLCLAVGGPIVSTSANKAGKEPALWPWLLQRQLGNELDYILPGQLGGAAKPSEIRELISDKVIRSG